ncbi:DoxX family membrane protein [Brevibacterium sp. FAM 25378]|uniref:DoxX family membrane protein n=1 Tax=unclassified Brevibacterium TaxID=2614124 RepID=UPI00109228AA|nr:DoxX family membrane protein [Brevibacterium sp. S22]TGD29949.1 DoxX family membrane protein [Brevibacterium sp. S22]
MFAVPTFIGAVVLLLVRALLTVAFVREFLVKAKDIPAFAKNDGLSVPVAWFVAIAELAAAVSFATGVLAQWAGLGVIVLMIITTSLHVFKWRSKYWASAGGPEYDLLLLVLAAVITAFGTGPISVPALFGM